MESILNGSVYLGCVFKVLDYYDTVFNDQFLWFDKISAVTIWTPIVEGMPILYPFGQYNSPTDYDGEELYNFFPINLFENKQFPVYDKIQSSVVNVYTPISNGLVAKKKQTTLSKYGYFLGYDI